MGLTASAPIAPIAPLLEYQPVRNVSSEHNLTEWENIGTKNFDFYSGQRFTVIPPELYLSCRRGYWYGYYESE